MKKYIKPETLVVAILTQSLIATSIGFNGTEVNGSQAEGREFEFDDDEY